MFYLVNSTKGKLGKVIGTCNDSTLEDVKVLLMKHLKYNEDYINTFRKSKVSCSEHSDFINSIFEVRYKFSSPDNEEYYLLAPRMCPITEDNTYIFETDKFKKDLLKGLISHSLELFDGAIDSYVTDSYKYDGVLNTSDNAIILTDEFARDIYGDYLDDIKDTDTFIIRNNYLDELSELPEIIKSSENVRGLFQACNIIAALDMDTFTVEGDKCFNEAFKYNSYLVTDEGTLPIESITEDAIFIDGKAVCTRDSEDNYIPQITIKGVPNMEGFTKEDLRSYIGLKLSVLLEMVTNDYTADVLVGEYYKRYDINLLVPSMDKLLSEVTYKLCNE